MENRFNYLLISLIALLIIGPIVEMLNISFPIGAIIFLIAIILTMRSVLDNKKVFYAQVGLAILAFVFTMIAQGSMTYRLLGVAGSFIYIVFIAWSISILIKRLLTEKRITADTIEEGICVYFLMGFLWALFYVTIYTFDNMAFSFLGTGALDYQFFSYYSFTALTTLGFGDITPINPLARSLTTLESIFGQLFLTVFIARLIGLYIAQELEKNNQ